MHELSLCQQIIRIITQYAKQHQVTQVSKIWLDIGELAGVEIEAIRFSFPIAARDSLAANAELIIHQIEGQGWCAKCGEHVKINRYGSLCPQCEGVICDISRGNEFNLQKIEAK